MEVELVEGEGAVLVANVGHPIVTRFCPSGPPVCEGQQRGSSQFSLGFLVNIQPMS